MKLTIFYITTGDKETATLLGNLSVEKKLAGCANIFPINSIFPWKDSLQHEEEFVLILKTIPANKNQLQSFLSEKHPYEIACLICWDVEVNEEYGEWIGQNVTY